MTVIQLRGCFRSLASFLQMTKPVRPSVGPQRWSSFPLYDCTRTYVSVRHFPSSLWRNSSSGHLEKVYPLTPRNTSFYARMMDNYKILTGYFRLTSTLHKPKENLVSPSGSAVTTKRTDSEDVTDQTSEETFGNYLVAYGRKSTFELLRTLSFFFLCRFSFFTEHSVKIMELSYRIFGHKLAESLIRKAAYDQFVAGETTNQVKMAAISLREGGVASILCVPIETDDQVGDGSPKEAFFDANLKKIISSVELALQLGDRFPMTQFRISALMSGDLMKLVSHYSAQTIHDPAVMEALTAAITGHNINISQLPGWQHFPHNREEEFRNGLHRLGKIKHSLECHDVIVLVDAEYTYLNPALRLLTLCLMKLCNTETTKVFYTYQAYLKATRKNLEQDLTYAATNRFGLGVKLVRGAYMVKERKLASELGYEDPVNATFDLTSASYHSCLDLLMEQVVMGPAPSVRFIVASHNEVTIRYAMARMNALGIPKDGSCVFFGQLYGMADHVSFTLGSNGYRVYKSVPYGPVLETLPYLARRAQENQAILINARRERKLVAKALADRIMFRRQII